MIPNPHPGHTLAYHTATLAQDLLALRGALDGPFRGNSTYADAIASISNGIGGLHRLKSELEHASAQEDMGDLVDGNLAGQGGMKEGMRNSPIAAPIHGTE